MVAGRPQEYDKEAIAEELFQWAKKSDSINLCAFCAERERPIPPSYISVWAKENEKFSQAYEITKAMIGARRERMLTANELHVKAYDLNATTYDYFLKEEKRREKEFEADVKANAEVRTAKEIAVTTVNYAGASKDTNNPSA